MGAGHIERWIAAELQKSNAMDAVTPVMIQQAMRSQGSFADAVRPLLLDGLRTIWNRTTPCWSNAFGNMARASEWTGNRVKVFLAGGGGLIPEARRVFSEPWGKHLGTYPCELLRAPDASVSADIPFSRMSVAYGLAIPVPELGDYVLPANVANHTPAPAPVRPVEIDGDQLSPKPGWI